LGCGKLITKIAEVQVEGWNRTAHMQKPGWWNCK